MGLLSFLRRSKQESVSKEAEFQSRAAEESNAVRGRRKRKQGGKQSGAAEEPVDPVLPEKKRARRRLIGAIALVLAVVIGLPMILDSEPKPLAEDIAIQIPSKDKQDKRPTPPARERSAVPSPQADKLSAAAGLDKNEEIVTLPPVSAATPVTALPKADATPQSSANPSGKPEIKVQAQESGKPEIRVEKTKTAFEKKPARFVIQVAALASHEKANELQGKLKGAGIKSQTQKIATQSGERIRVRVGPFGSKDEAEKMRARLAKMGLSGTLVPA